MRRLKPGSDQGSGLALCGRLTRRPRPEHALLFNTCTHDYGQAIVRRLNLVNPGDSYRPSVWRCFIPPPVW